MSERIYPADLDPLDSGRRGHKARYYLALGLVRRGDRVLDAACGCGYGTEMLATRARRVDGLDCDVHTIEYAKKRHLGDDQFTIQYFQQDLDTWEPTPGVYELVVSFETVEHLKGSPETFIEKLKSASNRTIVFSAPIVPTKQTNHHHLHDLTEQQILSAFQAGGEWVCYEAFHHRVYGVYIFVRKDKAHLL